MSANVAALFTRHLSQPARALYRHFVDDAWSEVTVGELATTIARWQAALVRVNLTEGDRIALCARNSVSWVAIDLAALGLKLVVVPLYVDDNPENALWCARHVEARLLIVESARSAAAFAAVRGEAPLPLMVTLHGDACAEASDADRFLGPATKDAIQVLDTEPDTLATICFTSGTAGRPKGVMLSHRNLIANVEQCRATNMARPEDRFLSMLPLSHMFERTGGYYLPLSLGATVAFARGIPQIAEDLASQQPTVVFAVPRILERFGARIAQALSASPIKRRLVDACVTRGYNVAMKHANLLDRMLAPLLRALTGRPILARMGGRLRLAVVGGAALDPALARTFIGLGLPVLQGYGMTEAAPVIAVNRDGDNVPESVGPPLPGVEVGIADDGELLARGPNIMLGYWRNEEATRAALDAQGWLHTGDLAEIRDGRIHIRGRAKDVFVMSNGEKLSPQDVEQAILRDPIFEQVMLIGDARPYVALLAVSKETNERALVKRANAQLTTFPRWVRVRHVIATTEPWSIDNGLLTPTLKLKRPLLLKRYAPRIQAAYQAEPIA